MPDLSDEQMAQIKKFVETFPEEEREAKLEEILSQFVADDKAPKTPQCPFCTLQDCPAPVAGKIQVAQARTLSPQRTRC